LAVLVNLVSLNSRNLRNTYLNAVERHLTDLKRGVITQAMMTALESYFNNIAQTSPEANEQILSKAVIPIGRS
jgi:hypothetical protein